MNNNTLIRTIAHNDPEILSYKERISNYVKQAEAQGMKYWLILRDSNPLCVVILGVEPVSLIAPIGTPLSHVKIIEPIESKESLHAAAFKAIQLSIENKAEYSYVWLSTKNESLVSEFIRAGYMEMGDTYEMDRSLNSFNNPPIGLQFVKVERNDLNRFLDYMKIHMSGSPDMVLEMILGNIKEMPDNFLDMWYSMEQLFWVYKNEEMVGMLDLNVNGGTISNIGVALEHRNQGYGRQIMFYGLDKLKNSGCNKAHLRVHVENKAAVHLYKSLGFIEKDRIKHLIWWVNKPNVHG